MSTFSMPVGSIPAPLASLAPALARAAQTVYSDWNQVDGWDEELGEGGICQDVASAMVGVLSENGFEHARSVSAAVGENHVFVVALLPGEGIFEIDILPSVYEIGSGYVWRKRQNIVIGDSDVTIARIDGSLDVEAFEEAYAFS